MSFSTRADGVVCGAGFADCCNDARVILLNYREDGITPYVTVWKHGVKEMKV